jgi:hypothetical protein
MKRRKTHFILGSIAVALILLVIAFWWSSSLPHDFRLTQGLMTPRKGHQAICLKDGRVLVFGGYTADLTTDSQNDTWSKYGSPRMVDDTSDVESSEMVLELTQLRSGNVFMSGGSFTSWNPWNLRMLGHPWSEYMWYWYYWRSAATWGAVSECDLFNWKTKQWKQTGPLLQPRCLHATTLLNDGRVLVTGGIGSDGKLIETCEIGTITENP